jgi:RNA polymerase sigma-70 factor (ECF subfamily)
VEPTDQELVVTILKEGDERAFRLLYERHTPRLLRLSRNLLFGQAIDPDDLVQETWIRAAARLASFEWRSSLITWLRGILVNLVREAHRARGHQLFVDLTDEVAAWPAPPDAAELGELEAAIASLAPGGRTILVLHDVEGYTHEEIAAFLEITPGTSKSQLCRARRSVVQFLNHERKKPTYVRT